jgi:hypothetical protein
LDRSERYIAVARLSLLWERVWPALWPATGIVGLFAAAALFDLFAQLPSSLHLILLLVDLGLAGYFLYRNFRNFRARLAGKRAPSRTRQHARPSPDHRTPRRLAAGAAIRWPKRCGACT